MFLLAQVLINVRSCRTKVCPKEIQEDVACNKILKPFCMQFRKDEAKPERTPKPEIREWLNPMGGCFAAAVVGSLCTSSFGLRPSFGFRFSGFGLGMFPPDSIVARRVRATHRSEERRVGKECRSR